MLKKLGMAHTNKSYYQKYAKINKTVRSFIKVISICIRILEASSLRYNASCQINKCFGWEMKKKDN